MQRQKTQTAGGMRGWGRDRDRHRDMNWCASLLHDCPVCSSPSSFYPYCPSLGSTAVHIHVRATTTTATTTTTTTTLTTTTTEQPSDVDVNRICQLLAQFVAPRDLWYHHFISFHLISDCCCWCCCYCYFT